MSKASLFWHDYETFGTDPQRDRPVQFAGVRTDPELNIIGEPVTLYCRVALDYLPNPEACLITGIVPQHVEKQGLSEAEFIAQIHEQLALPQTCTVGFNNLRFDDEVTRHALYRNFYDPYAREWQNGNSRWDLIDVCRAARALRPDGMVWPCDEQGVSSLKLELLTQANGISHTQAHDALADVYATIAIAKLLKSVQPKLYQFLWLHRGKEKAKELLQVGSFIPLVHVSGRYSARKQGLAIILPICIHPCNPNGVLVYDLSVAPDDLLDCSAQEIQQRLFTSTANLPEDMARIPLKTVHINKCPVLAPISVIRPADAERLTLDIEACHENARKIAVAHQTIVTKLTEVFKPAPNDQPSDPDLSLYSGGFFSDQDRKTMNKIRALAPDQLEHTQFSFNDARLPEMLFRYRARNYPETLSPQELQDWHRVCMDKLSGNLPGAGLLFQDYLEQLAVLKESRQDKAELLRQLHDYGLQVAATIGLAINQ